VDKGGRVLQMRTSTLFNAKHIRFFEIYGVSTRSRGISLCEHFAGVGGGKSIFRDFVRTSSYYVRS